MVEFKKLWWMVRKEWISLKRHPTRLVAIIVFPIIMILLFGYGMGGDLENLNVVVVAQDEGALTDATLDVIKDMEIYHVVDIIDDADEGRKMVDNGDVKAAIILPSNYDEEDSNQKAVTLYIDSSDQMATQSLVPTTQALFNEISAKQAAFAGSTSVKTENATTNPVHSSINSVKSAIALQVNRIYGDIKYIDYLVPAVLAMTIMMSCMMGMGASISGERETGELARLFMTPTSVATVVGGKIIGKLSVELIRALILLFAAIILFGVTVKGGIPQTFILLVVGALCFVGFGIMISATAKTQEDYAQLVLPFQCL